jgi:spermidine/putrescine transport system substrate-binding protein
MKKLIAATAMLLASTALASAEGVLNLYNWGNYTSPELLEKFEKETGIKVTVTDFSSNDEALAKVEAGGSGFDMVVPSANFVQIYVEKGLLQELDHAKLTNIGNIAPEWANPDWDPNRAHTVPWQWGLTGVAVNRKVYQGDINTSAIFLDPPEELKGKLNVVPEMNDVISMALRYVGAEQCSEDTEALKKVRDLLVAAKPGWVSMEYSTIDKMAKTEWAATSDWNGSVMRQRQQNPDIEFGFPKEGFPYFMDSVAILADAPNADNAYQFLNFILLPENAAMISSFARYANGVAGSDAFMPEDMKTAPELNVPADLKDAGYFLQVCSPKAQEYYTAIWTELLK